MPAPIEPRFKVLMNDLARILDDHLNPTKSKKTVGFTILMFEFGAPKSGRMNYISNAVREDMIAAMKEFIASVEGRVVDTEGHS